MTRETRDALALVERVADAGTQADPDCSDCHGDGSVEVDGNGEPCDGSGAFKRCPCWDRVDRARELVFERLGSARFKASIGLARRAS